MKIQSLQENDCFFMNSIGMMKSCNFYSNEKTPDFLYKMLSNQFDGMSIYVCGEMLNFFVYNILQHIHKHFILVTGDSDLTFCEEVLTIQHMHMLYNSIFLIKILAQNSMIHTDNRIIQMPIGLDYHTINNNPNHHWTMQGEPTNPKEQENILLSIKSNAEPFYHREPKIYCNFTKTEFQDRWQHRTESLKIIPTDLLAENNIFTPRTINWKKMAQYTFVLSPFGRGMDCHRTWESLALGCIPIVKAPHFKKMYDGLPILIISDWKEITKELLDKTIEDFKKQIFDYKKLELSYWKNQIK